MNEIQKKCLFESSLAQVWSFWIQVDKTPGWVDGVLESERTSEVSQGTGLSWKEKCSVMEHVLIAEHCVTHWDEGRCIIVETKLPMGAVMKRSITFAVSAKDRSEVHIVLSWNLGMAAAFVDEARLRGVFENGLEKTLQNWQAAMRVSGSLQN